MGGEGCEGGKVVLKQRMLHYALPGLAVLSLSLSCAELCITRFNCTTPNPFRTTTPRGAQKERGRSFSYKRYESARAARQTEAGYVRVQEVGLGPIFQKMPVRFERPGDLESPLPCGLSQRSRKPLFYPDVYGKMVREEHARLECQR